MAAAEMENSALDASTTWSHGQHLARRRPNPAHTHIHRDVTAPITIVLIVAVGFKICVIEQCSSQLDRLRVDLLVRRRLQTVHIRSHRHCSLFVVS